jgi:hypothetical protein
MRGRAFALVEAVYLGSAAAGTELLEPLRRLGPVIDTIGPVAPADISGPHMDPADPVAYDGLHQLIDDLPGKAVDEIVRLAGAGSAPRCSASSSDTSVARLAAARPATALWARRRDRSRPSASESSPTSTRPPPCASGSRCCGTPSSPTTWAGRFPNFALHTGEPSRFFDETTLARMRRVRAEIDPDGQFLAKHAI